VIEFSAIGIIFGWVILAALLSWLAPEAWRMRLAATCGAGLLASLSPLSLAILAAATLASFHISRLRRHQRAARYALMISLAVGYLLLLWRSAADQNHVGGTGWLLPFGMAYYVLRLVHYLSEMDRGTLRPHSLTDYICYQFFAPTLAVGPIHRFDGFLRDLRRRRWDPDLVSAGLGRVLTGAARIVILGNYLLAQKLDGTLRLAVSGSPAWTLYLDTLLYWLNIYIQFGGYSDLAIGFGAIMGFQIPENFNLPFLARNIGDFWRRWHMTLSGWCRDYVYLPVLALTRRPFLAFSGSMLVLGLWHAVSLHYILWGLYHATGLTVWRQFEKRSAGWQQNLSRPARWCWEGAARVLTLHFVIFSYPIANAIEQLILAP
jgi:alginate O-acetyltransferase complex protein AlgI